MTEPPQLPSPDTRDDQATAPPPEPPVRRNLAPWLNAAGFLILAAAIVWVWWHPDGQRSAQADALAAQLGTLEAKITHLEQQPVQAPPDLGKMSARVAALEQRPPQPAQGGTPVDLAPLTARVAALEQHSPKAAPQPDLAPLDARISALEAKQPTDAQLTTRLDALTARIDAISAGQRTAQSDAERRLDANEARLAAIERSTGQIATLVDRANRLARIQAAQLALDRGQPLGDLPGAPPALTRFATAKPPTEASLRLAFPSAARAAIAAARPSTEDKPVLTRLWAQAQDLVTIREGDRVLLGDPAAGVLERARVALDAGDLAGAVTAVGSLTDPAAKAMADWLAQARSLLDARAALADWAAHA